MSGIVTLRSPPEIEAGAAYLAGLSPVWARVIKQTSPLPMRQKPQGFSTLLDAIVGQQVSVASAKAIWSRLCEQGLDDQQAMRGASAEMLAKCGLSRPKIRYALALAASDLDWAGLDVMPDAQVIAALTAQLGVGRWTADVYALQALGRADVFPAGDLALQEAARVAFDLPARPSERDFRAMSQAWRPYRAVAARALWAYYRIIKQREGIS